MRPCAPALQYHAIPPKVVITEHVDIAKAFCADDAPGMFNGALDAIAKTVESKG